ncbi:MAG: hypothetical protein ACD_4C00142G0005 [uncultured bacterium (gcode 4)]|uniref:Uncharacterized protein n=1 Tax=uncultured bacterium (gcode 4) TaxID=1234023 RepID=K2F6S2_9BACT|nr:MAG: hypothetical protein ACD_4C00142G0005 [uncultured bacterium (gcode 4)]
MFSWNFQSKKDKSSSWYTIAIIIWLALIIWWFIMGLYIMSIVIFIFAWVYILIENNSPEIIDIEINENWINVWETFYDFPKIETFSIIYNKNIPAFLRLKLRTRWFKILDIPFDKSLNVASLRAFLLDYLNEDEKWEINTMDRLIDYLKL